MEWDFCAGIIGTYTKLFSVIRAWVFSCDMVNKIRQIKHNLFYHVLEK